VIIRDLLNDKDTIMGDFLPIAGPGFRSGNQEIPDGGAIDYFRLFCLKWHGEN
jgi:hypothetical protein